MTTVWKFQIQIIDVQSVMMPAHARVLHVGLDPQGQPCLWAEVQSENQPVKFSVHVTGTGHPMPEGDNRHVGSFTQGPFVWHVWMPC